MGLLLLSAISFVGSAFPLLNTIAEPATSTTPSSSPTKGTWANILKMVSTHPLNSQGGGSRGSNFCLIAPGQLGDKPQIWNERPMFFWKNSTKSTDLEFRLYSPFNTQQGQIVLWRKRITTEAPVSEFQNAQYQGETLKNSQKYQWEYVDQGEHKKINGNFKLLSNEEHQHIAKDLKDLEMKLQSEGKTAEEIVLKKTEYFASKKLWSDALQELSLVDNHTLSGTPPTPTFVSQRQKLFDSFCENPK